MNAEEKKIKQNQTSIETLTKLITEHQEYTDEIGHAIGLLKFCDKHSIGPRSNVISIPEETREFSDGPL